MRLWILSSMKITQIFSLFWMEILHSWKHMNLRRNLTWWAALPGRSLYSGVDPWGMCCLSQNSISSVCVLKCLLRQPSCKSPTEVEDKTCREGIDSLKENRRQKWYVVICQPPKEWILYPWLLQIFSQSHRHYLIENAQIGFLERE